MDYLEAIWEWAQHIWGLHCAVSACLVGANWPMERVMGIPTPVLEGLSTAYITDTTKNNEIKDH